METKRCPKCGGEIPVGMQFCLHCMERTDGVLEIKQKHTISRKRILLAVIVLFILTTAIFVLLSMRNSESITTQDASSVSEETTAANTSEPEQPHTESTNPLLGKEADTVEERLTERLLPLFYGYYYELEFDEQSCYILCYTIGSNQLSMTADYDDKSFTLTISEDWHQTTFYQKNTYLPDFISAFSSAVLDFNISYDLYTQIEHTYTEYYQNDATESFTEDVYTCTVTVSPDTPYIVVKGSIA